MIKLANSAAGRALQRPYSEDRAVRADIQIISTIKVRVTAGHGLRLLSAILLYSVYKDFKSADSLYNPYITVFRTFVERKLW